MQDDIRANVVTLVQDYETLDVLVYNPSTSIVVQQQQEVIELQMDIMIRIRSSVQIDEQKDKELFMRGPWDTPSERLAFAAWLREYGGDCFEHVADTSPLLLSRQAASEREGVSPIMVAVAAVLGALAFCCCAVCGIVGYRRRTPPKTTESHKDSHQTNDAFLEIACDTGTNDISTLGDPIGPHHAVGGVVAYTTAALPPPKTAESHDNAFLEIACESATNEISTLGDPIGPYHATPLMGVSTVGSTSLDYDYQLAFGKLPQSQDEDEFTGIGTSTTMSQREDVEVDSLKHLVHPAMLERLKYNEIPFRVTASKGPLGLFLRSHPTDGRPMVVHVKQTSCLAACVQPGDCLVVVNDDIVVTQYTPARVSQLLVSLMRQEEEDGRISLIFSRPTQ